MTGTSSIDNGLTYNSNALRAAVDSFDTLFIKKNGTQIVSNLDGSVGAVNDTGLTTSLFSLSNNTTSGNHQYTYYSVSRNSPVDDEFQTIKGFEVPASAIKGPLNDVAGNKGYGFYSNVNTGINANVYNFFAGADASNFFKGGTYIGGTPSRNTRELWESTLTEEQKEQLSAGTLAIPANVSTPGDGSFARQWWYEQQSVEDQALIDSGELEYPEHLAAATFTDTFSLLDTTNIALLGTGAAVFKGIITAGAPTGGVINFARPSDGAPTVSIGYNTNFLAANVNNKFGVWNPNGQGAVNIGITGGKLSVQNIVSGTYTEVAFIDESGTAYFKGEVRGGGSDGANPNWTIAANGTATGITVTRATVVTDEQSGTVETLLDIITDLRARVAALEAA